MSKSNYIFIPAADIAELNIIKNGKPKKTKQKSKSYKNYSHTDLFIEMLINKEPKK